MATFDPADYVPVQARIKRFWEENPDGAVVTRMMSPPDDFDRCRYEAQVFKHKDDARPSATGYAFELAGGRGPNATSHEENCETSAIGRALANMGYATTPEERPSREEMAKAARGPVAVPPVQPQPMADTTNKRLHAAAGDKGIDHEGVRFCAWSLYGAESTKGLTDAEGRELGTWFERLAPVEAEYLGRIVTAADDKALEKVGAAMKAAGVGGTNDLLKATYSRRNRGFQTAAS